jgi:hypothetical protein
MDFKKLEKMIYVMLSCEWALPSKQLEGEGDSCPLLFYYSS